MIVSHDIFEREDGLFQFSLADDAPAFPSRQFALRVASGDQPEPVPVSKVRHFKVIQGMHRNA